MFFILQLIFSFLLLFRFHAIPKVHYGFVVQNSIFISKWLDHPLNISREKEMLRRVIRRELIILDD